MHTTIGGNMISIRIHLLANKGKQNELRQAIENLSQRMVMEVGCLGCRVFQSTSNECELVLIEEWDNLESVQAHIASSNMSILVGAGKILTQSIRVCPERDPEIQTLKNIYKTRFSPKIKTV